MGLTLVVCDNLNLSILHDSDTGVGCSQIDTDDRARDSIAVFLDWLILSMCCLGQHQAANQDEEKVKGDGPCRALAGAP